MLELMHDGGEPNHVLGHDCQRLALLAGLALVEFAQGLDRISWVSWGCAGHARETSCTHMAHLVQSCRSQRYWHCADSGREEGLLTQFELGSC